MCSTSQSSSTLNCTSTTRMVVLSSAVCIDVVDVCDNIVTVYAMLAYGLLKGDCERVANEKSHEDIIYVALLTVVPFAFFCTARVLDSARVLNFPISDCFFTFSFFISYFFPSDRR